ncbi:glycosyltransferase family 9 protein [Pseudomonadota bacterium]
MLIIDLPVAIFTSRHSTQDKSICVIRLDNIGDFILWLDAAKGMRKFYHDRTLVLFVDKALSELASDIGLWDEVWPIDRRQMKLNPLYRFKMLCRVRKRGFDTAIQPTFSRELLFGDALVLATGASKRIGSVGDLSNILAWQKKISDRWYTQLIPAKQEPLMELLRNAEFLRGLGYNSFRAQCPQLPMHQHSREYSLESPYYLIFPGASDSIKKWTAASYAQLTDWLFEYSGYQGVICGAIADQVDAEKIQRYSKAPLKNLTGCTSLSELSDVIAGARLLISNDTCAVHIAAAVGTPVVCILGGGHYRRFLPYQIEQSCDIPLPMSVIHSMSCFGCNWQCCYDVLPNQSVPCVAQITVESVIEAVKPVIDSTAICKDSRSDVIE